MTNLTLRGHRHNRLTFYKLHIFPSFPISSPSSFFISEAAGLAGLPLGSLFMAPSLQCAHLPGVSSLSLLESCLLWPNSGDTNQQERCYPEELTQPPCCRRGHAGSHSNSLLRPLPSQNLPGLSGVKGLQQVTAHICKLAHLERTPFQPASPLSSGSLQLSPPALSMWGSNRNGQASGP